MRIQETDRILKESRVSRNAVHEHEEGRLSRLWHRIAHLPTKLSKK
jgi:hypothetical protein